MSNDPMNQKPGIDSPGLSDKESRASGTGFALFGGGVLILAGALMLGHSMGYFYFPPERLIKIGWPLVLIVIGLWLIVKRQRDLNKTVPEFSAPVPQSSPSPTKPEIVSQSEPIAPGITNISPLVTPPPGTIPSAIGSGQAAGSGNSGQFNAFTRPAPAEKIRYSKFIGDQEINILGESIEDMEVSFFIGETLVDLRRARLSPGLNRVIVSGFIGEVRVLVPSTVPLFVRCSNFAGDISALGKRTSGFGNNLDAQNLLYSQSGSRLYIAVNNFAGDITVQTDL